MALAPICGCANGSPAPDDPSSQGESTAGERRQGGAGATTVVPGSEASVVDDLAAGAGGSAGADARSPWPAPDCDVMDSWGLVSWSGDLGQSMMPTTGAPSAWLDYGYYDAAVLPLSTPGSLLTARHMVSALSNDPHQSVIWRSTDSGCSWHEVGAVDHWPLLLTYADGESAFGWVRPFPRAEQHTDGIPEAVAYAVRPASVEQLETPQPVHAMGAASAEHVRFVSTNCGVFDSTDGGKSWSAVSPGPGLGTVRHSAMSPTDPDHVLCSFGDRLEVTFDGGATWSTAVGLTGSVERITVSPLDAALVWAITAAPAADADPERAVRSESRLLVSSDDGGRNWTPRYEMQNGTGVFLGDSTVLVADPTDQSRVFFADDNLSYYDLASDEVSFADLPLAARTRALAVVPGNPVGLYFGISQFPIVESFPESQGGAQDCGSPGLDPEGAPCTPFDDAAQCQSGLHCHYSGDVESPCAGTCLPRGEECETAGDCASDEVCLEGYCEVAHG